MRTDGKRYCTYCRLPKDPEGFKRVVDKQGRLRNYKCGDCVAIGKKPIEAREANSKRRNAEAKAAQARRMREVTEARMTQKSEG